MKIWSHGDPWFWQMINVYCLGLLAKDVKVNTNFVKDIIPVIGESVPRWKDFNVDNLVIWSLAKAWDLVNILVVNLAQSILSVLFTHLGSSVLFELLDGFRLELISLSFCMMKSLSKSKCLNRSVSHSSKKLTSIRRIMMKQLPKIKSLLQN